jgi:hypothetical protein
MLGSVHFRIAYQCIASVVDVKELLFMIGETPNQYRIGEQLGGGGMGDVYFFDDASLDSKVALKFIPDT